MRIGIFGGTFDPPHVGHLIVAQDAALALGLDRILFVPAAVPPHKRGITISPPDVRRRMLELALADAACFAIDTLELDRSGPSYTVDTLRELARRSAAEWTLLIGVDQYLEFHTWREPGEIRRLADLAVLERGGAGLAGGAAGAPRPATVTEQDGTRHVDVTRVDVSSTLVRARVAAGLPIRYIVPAAVEQFIRDEGLYVRNGTPLAG